MIFFEMGKGMEKRKVMLCWGLTQVKKNWGYGFHFALKGSEQINFSFGLM